MTTHKSRKHKAGVRAAATVPQATERGTIQLTEEWLDTVRRVEAGITGAIEIRLPASLADKMRDPVAAFMAAAKRRWRKGYRVFSKGGVIYILRRT